MAPKAKPSEDRHKISCNREGSWVTEEVLADLAVKGFLPPKENNVWRAPGDEIDGTICARRMRNGPQLKEAEYSKRKG